MKTPRARGKEANGGAIGAALAAGHGALVERRGRADGSPLISRRYHAESGSEGALFGACLASERLDRDRARRRMSLRDADVSTRDRAHHRRQLRRVPVTLSRLAVLMQKASVHVISPAQAARRRGQQPLAAEVVQLEAAAALCLCMTRQVAKTLIFGAGGDLPAGGAVPEEPQAATLMLTRESSARRQTRAMRRSRATCDQPLRAWCGGRSPPQASGCRPPRPPATQGRARRALAEEAATRSGNPASAADHPDSA